ncbi:Fpg/Nei family DNA glycosylase [Propionibacterium sp.]|uniref:Fpg/Nei family DNA glycosylase n=1 Tax=Propionibacterium sp. TaxID=1977903 RepID=UPI0039E7E364
MPELPQVEALVRLLRGDLVGHVITRVEVGSPSVLKTFAYPPERLVGQEITAVTRHGKFLDIGAPPLHSVFHLARAGWLVWHDDLPERKAGPGRGRIALRIGLDSGAGFDLTEAGTKHRLAVYIVVDPCEVPAIQGLGIDPLTPEFTVNALQELLSAAGRTRLKGLLRDQRVIAGIGNAYSDEILHDARLSPFKPCSALSPEEVKRLYTAIVGGLKDALDHTQELTAAQLKADKRTRLRIHGRTGEPCPDCGMAIAEVSFADSSLQYCPHCQTGGKVLADRRMSRLLK